MSDSQRDKRASQNSKAVIDLKSNGSTKQAGGGCPLVSISNETSSYGGRGPDAVHENTIDQILGNIEKSNIGRNVANAASPPENFVTRKPSESALTIRQKINEDKIYSGGIFKPKAIETQFIPQIQADFGAKMNHMA